jgi:hypothetical protein
MTSPSASPDGLSGRSSSADTTSRPTPVSPRVRRDLRTVARQEESQAIRVDRYHNRPEVYVESDRVARIITGIAAVLITFGTVRLVFEVQDRFAVPDLLRPLWFRLPQLLLGVAAIAISVVEVSYLVMFTITDRIWRRWRGVTILFAIIVSAWTAVWFIDRFALDPFLIP